MKSNFFQNSLYLVEKKIRGKYDKTADFPPEKSDVYIKRFQSRFLKNGESRMGQDVINIFHRVFHTLGFKIKFGYVNPGKKSKRQRKKESLCK